MLRGREFGKEEKHGSDTDSDADEKGDAKRLKLGEENGEEDPEERKARLQREREALWKSFKEEASASAQRKDAPQPKMIKVVKTMRFAGEDVKQVIEVPEGSKEAKQWPRLDETGATSQTVQTITSPNPVEVKPTQQSGISQTPSSSLAPSSFSGLASSSSTSALSSAASTPKPTPPPGSGPRKRKTLAAIPTAKPRKISTLDKGMMDWSSHLSSSSNQQVREELEANRRGGGYIERVEFMERVSERKEEGRQQLAGSKRRK